MKGGEEKGRKYLLVPQDRRNETAANQRSSFFFEEDHIFLLQSPFSLGLLRSKSK
jgi:hypothetical protein